MYKLPIGANHGLGYFLIENKGELNEYIDTLHSRIIKITDRKARITTHYYKFYDSEEFEITGDRFGDDELSDDMQL